MDTNLTVNACIGVRDGCGMKCLVNADGQIEFSLGSRRYPFELAFDVPALRHFVQLAGLALEQVAVAMVKGQGDAGETDKEAQP